MQKTQSKFIRLLSAILATAMCLFVLPVTALAEEIDTTKTYTRVTSLNDLMLGGEFILAAEYDGNYYALGNTIGSKIDPVEVTVSDDVINADSLPVWTVEAADTGVAFKSGTDYLAYGSSASFKKSTDAYAWNVAEVTDNGTFRFSASGNETRAIAYGTSQNKFGAYAALNTSGYVFDLMVFKAGSDDNKEETSDSIKGVLTNKIAQGDQVVVYYPESTLAITSTANGSKLTGTEASVNDNTVTADLNAAVFTVRVTDDKYYTFENNGKYLTSGASGNSLSMSDKNEYSLWDLFQTATTASLLRM